MREGTSSQCLATASVLHCIAGVGHAVVPLQPPSAPPTHPPTCNAIPPHAANPTAAASRASHSALHGCPGRSK